MAKIGILSMQRIKNYGSFLQAYALKNILIGLGHQVEFVDYHVDECVVQSESNYSLLRKFNKAIESLLIKGKFKNKMKYLCYKRDYSKKYYPLLGVGNELNYLPELDYLIIGSDEVFNCIQSNPNVGYSLELFGKDNKARHLISYAASFGNTTLDKICEYNIFDELKFYLSKFECISVRDNNSKSIIEKMLNKEPFVNLDPVLIYDFNNDLKIQNKRIFNFKYIVLYGYNGRFTKEECLMIKKIARDGNLKIVCLGGLQHWCDYFYDASPLDVINLFKYSEFVITDTFHGSILSIINNKQFVSLIRNTGYGNSQKMYDLLARLKLEDRICENLDNLLYILSKKIDWEVTNSIIKKERINTIKYFKTYIQN